MSSRYSNYLKVPQRRASKDRSREKSGVNYMEAEKIEQKS